MIILMAVCAILALLIGLPIAFIFLALCFLLVISDPFVSVSAVPRTFVQGLDSFILLAIPLFVLVGNIMSSGSITQRLLDLAMILVGHWRAGLAQVNIMASLIFSGISGSTTSDVAGLGRVEIPMMIKAGYKPETAATITAVSACIGPLVPPSVPLILYGALTGTSIGKLFLAGIIPGLLLGATLMIVIGWLAMTGGIAVAKARNERASLKEFTRVLWRSVPALLTPVILVGGIIGGFFTPTEAGAIAVVYALMLTFAVYRDLTLRDLWTILCDTAETVGIIMIVVGAAASFGWLITQAGAASAMLDFVTAIDRPAWMILLLVLAILLAIGLFVEATSMIILLSPILVPLVVYLGMDPVHFGIVFTMSVMIAVITPPVGICSYIAASIANVGMHRLTRELLPYVGTMILFLLVIAFVPQLSTFLPALIFG